jgi:adenylate kinase family enzyme
MTNETGAFHFERPFTLLFAGMQGSGKGTQADMLKTYLEAHDSRPVIFLSSGELLRKYCEEHTTFFAKHTKEIMAQGGLVPTFVANYILNYYLTQVLTEDAHVLLDGVARTIMQAEILDETLIYYGREDFRVVLLDISLQVARERAIARGRSDDNVAALDKRFKWFHDDVLPALALLGEKGHPILTIDGTKTPDEVHTQVRQELGILA